jgi:hypothetical protein
MFNFNKIDKDYFNKKEIYSLLFLHRTPLGRREGE